MGATQYSRAHFPGPTPNGRMALESACNLPNQELLGFPNLPFRIIVPDGGFLNAALGENRKFLIPFATLEHPGGKPVDSHHVSGEEGREKLQPLLPSYFGSLNEAIQCLR